MTIGGRIGARLRELRRQSGASLRELADRSGMHRQNLLRIERGDHSPNLESVCCYAGALGVPVASVVCVLDDLDAVARDVKMARLVEWQSAAPDRTLSIEHGTLTDHAWCGAVCDQRAGYPDDGTVIDVFDQGAVAESLDELLDELLAAVEAMERAS